jgi:hypothetical protein
MMIIKNTINNIMGNVYNKFIFGVAMSFVVITLCFIGIIAATYFFVIFASKQFADFVTTLPTYHVTLGAITSVALAYIFKRYQK